MGAMVDAILPQLRPPAASQARPASTAADTVGRALTLTLTLTRTRTRTRT